MLVLSSPIHPDRLWGPASLQCNVCQGSFPRVKSTTHLHLVPRFRMSGAIPLPPLDLYGLQRENFTLYYASGVSVAVFYTKKSTTSWTVWTWYITFQNAKKYFSLKPVRLLCIWSFKLIYRNYLAWVHY